MNKSAKAFVNAATDMFGPNAVISRDQIQKVVEDRSVPYPFWFVTRQEFRVGRGNYRLPDTPDDNKVPLPVAKEQPMNVAQTVDMAATVHVLR